jgi:hypothetical protein
MLQDMFRDSLKFKKTIVFVSFSNLANSELKPEISRVTLAPEMFLSGKACSISLLISISKSLVSYGGSKSGAVMIGVSVMFWTII